MTIATQRSTLYRTLLLLGVVSLVACGGGGGGGTTPNNSSKAESSLSSNVASSVASSIVATSSSSVAVVDTTPAVFNFSPTTDAALSTAITSPAVTLSGFDVAVPISITNGEYSIDGGAFTSAAGTISPAQTLAVKVTSSNANSTAVTTTLTVGGVSATYTVTTLADAIPDAFSFTPAVNVVPSSTNTSAPITLSGIEVATAISITGGEYSINGGAFTAAAGTVTNGQTVAVKAVAPTGTELTQNAVVTIGGVSGTYSVTTVPDTTPPVAEFKFPTPYTMSEAMSVKVRGTATDENAITSVKVIVSNNLNATVEEKEVTPKAEGDYSSWTVDVPLTALAENEIKVVATDDRNNVIQLSDANKVVIQQADVKSAFPDEDNMFESFDSKLVLDNYDGRNRLLVLDNDFIMSVDMITGVRTKFIEERCDLTSLTVDPVTKHLFGTCGGSHLKEFNLIDGALIGDHIINIENFTRTRALKIDRNNGRSRLVLVEESDDDVPGRNGSVIAFSLETKTFSVISPEAGQPLIQAAESVVVDGDRYLVPGGRFDSNFGGQIISVDALTGDRTIISDNSIGSGDLYTGYIDEIETAFLSSMVVDSKNSRFLAFEFRTNKIFAIDPLSFNRRIFTDVSYKQQDNGFDIASTDMKSDETAGHLYLVDWNRQAVIIVDSETGEKVILSKSKNSY